MSTLPKQVVEISIRSELGYEKIPMAALVILAHMMDFEADRIENLKMAVGEAVTNAIEHGNQEDSDTQVHVTFTRHATHLAILVVDQGLKSIPDIQTERGDRIDNRGWGFPFIKKFMDEATTLAKSGRNEMRMVAYLKK